MHALPAPDPETIAQVSAKGDNPFDVGHASGQQPNKSCGWLPRLDHSMTSRRVTASRWHVRAEVRFHRMPKREQLCRRPTRTSVLRHGSHRDPTTVSRLRANLCYARVEVARWWYETTARQRRVPICQATPEMATTKNPPLVIANLLAEPDSDPSVTLYSWQDRLAPLRI